MKKILLILIISVINKSSSQNRLNGIVLNYQTKEPIEYVDIYNKNNFTSTNSDGRFLFNSENDSIKIRLIGYESIFTNFKKINDTIFLKSKFEELDEIIISNKNPIIKIYNSVVKNYPSEPYTEIFFLRCQIRKNGKLLKIQDLNGLVNRKMLFGTSERPMPKKNYKLEILNVRKAGIEEDIDFVMLNFKQILEHIAGIGLNIQEYKFNKSSSQDKNFIKYSFFPKPENKIKIEGYYLINENDNAITEFKIKEVLDDSYKKRRNFKYKTNYIEKLTFFKKNIAEGKYFIHKAKINSETEIINENGKKDLYNETHSFIVLNQTNLKLNKKHSIKKDVFKFKKPFNLEFWNKQEYLLLTGEMNDFLKKLKDTNIEFKTVTNMKE
jgi:hypothetical protein